MNKKKLIIIISSIIVIIAILVVSILLIRNYYKNKDNTSTTNEVYAVIKQVNEDSIIVSDKDENGLKTYIINPTGYKKGDLVLIKTKDGKVEDIKVIIEDYASLTTTNEVVVVDDTTATTTTSIVTTKPATTRTTTNTTKIEDKDSMILSYMSSSYENVKNGSVKDTLKNGFVSVVDFIFYDQPIKGVTFKELRNKTKTKVIYYALLIDAGIDSKFPGYKETLSDKYKSAKSKLLAEFLELKYSMCEKSEDGCKQASDDLALLKKSLNLTWDIIKSVFGYVKDLTVPKIKSWYESFRG